MVDGSLLWSSAARKEAFELLVHLWSHGGADTRAAISAAIVDGPPQGLFEEISPQERAAARDRRIFDRIAVLERLPGVPLTAGLAAEWGRIRALYPGWQVAPGEQAYFGIWMHTDWEPSRSFTAEDLRSTTISNAIDILERAADRDDFSALDGFRELWNEDAPLAIQLLQEMARSQRYTVGVWQQGLWSAREHVKLSAEKESLFSFLESLPDGLMTQPKVSEAVSDILDTSAGLDLTPSERISFWRLFDVVLRAVDVDGRNGLAPTDDDWVSAALNCSMGRLASAFFTALFERELKVGAGIPEDLVSRLDQLISPGTVNHRLARVIAASRLSYLYAIDPKWTRSALIPSFNWEDEAESLAVWQGYGWQPRIDEKLWDTLRPHFFQLFEPQRVERLGEFGERHAQLLFVVGTEFGVAKLPLPQARAAVEVMSSRLRTEGLTWIVDYLEHRRESADVDDGRPLSSDVDIIWEKRVWPFIEATWPRQKAEQHADTSIQFGRMAVQTDKSFASAVDRLRPFFVAGPENGLLRDLEKTTHPERFPATTFDLINLAINPREPRYGVRRLAEILTRVLSADPGITRDFRFAPWRSILAEDGL